METAVADSARLILTGQAQTSGFDQAGFKTAVCQKVFGLFDCANGVYVDVKTFTSFGNVTMNSPLDASGNFVDNSTYQSRRSRRHRRRALFYQWPVYLSLLGFTLSNMSGGKRLLVATAAFRNEPYGS